MNSIKHVVLFLLLFVGFAGCGATPATKSGTAVKKTKTKYKKIEVPREIARGEMTIWQKDLFLLPTKHPRRFALRDRLAEELYKYFKDHKETEIDQRLELFEEALWLHDPNDFRQGRVSPAVVPMAEWIAGAFERRGDEAVVLAALRFRMLAAPANVRIKEQYLELAEWSESVRKTIDHPIDQLSSLIEMYHRMVQLVPDREVVEYLAKKYVERHRLITAIFKRAGMRGLRQLHPFEIMRQQRLLDSLPTNLLYIFFLAGEPAGARKHLEEFVSSSPEGSVHIELIDFLDRIFHDTDPADSYFTLANKLAPVDARAGLKASIAARAADPDNPKFSLFIGRSFEELDRPECAFDFYAEATNVAPEDNIFNEVLELVRQALLKVHTNEMVRVSERAIEIGDMLVDKALALSPAEESELRVNIATLLYSMGEVEFDDGRIESSKQHLERSFEAMANIPSLIKLTEVNYLLGEFASGIEILSRADKIQQGGRGPRGFSQAIILEKRADLIAGLGRNDEAQQIYRQALKAWDSAEIISEQAPFAAVRRGVILDSLGDRLGSQDAFRLAVRLDPNREGTYAQLISFLVIRGRLEDAKEFYRLAYNQDQIEAMWKIYYSLWVEGLSQRQGKGSYDLARGYLQQREGSTWQDKLARYYFGKMTTEALHKEATNTGQHVEVEYYSALVDLAQGKKSEARAKLEKVIASNLLGFFEYRMARALLRRELAGASK